VACRAQTLWSYGRYGRRDQRRSRRGRGPWYSQSAPVTREQLDIELDEFMSGSRPQLDTDIDAYMAAEDVVH